MVDNQTASHPQVGDLPWPVVLLLGAHARKHILQGKTCPDLAKVATSIMQFGHKLQWRFPLKNVTDNPTVDGIPLHSIKLSNQLVLLFSGCRPIDIFAFTAAVHYDVLQAVQAPCQTRSGEKDYENTNQHN